MPAPLSKDKVQNIIDLYKAGVTSPQIAKRLQCSKRSVLDYLHKNNVKIKRQGGRKYKAFDVEFLKDPNPDAAYFIGFIAGDGCVRKTTSGSEMLSIKLHVKDLELLKKFRKRFKISHPICIKQNMAMLRITQGGLLKSFRRWNIIPRKTYKMSLPKFEKPDMLRHYLSGLFDADGCISSVKYKNGYTRIKSIGLVSYSFKFLKSIQRQLKKSNIYSRVYRETPSVSRLFIYAASVETLYEYLYKDRDLFLLRKKRVYDKIIQDLKACPVRKTWNKKYDT